MPTELERFFDLSIDLLCVFGYDGYDRRVNPAFQRTLGFTEEELLAQPFVDFVHPDDRAASFADLESLDSRSAGHLEALGGRLEVVSPRGDGTILTAELLVPA